MLSARILPTGGTARVAGFDVVKAAARVRSLIGVEIPTDPVTAGSHRRGARVHAPFDGACDAGRVLRDRPVLLLGQRQRAGAQDCADHVNRLVRLRESRRLTIVVALDTLDHVTTLCDQVALLDRGQIVALDSPWALLSGIEDVIVEFEPFGDAPAILQELHSHGMSIHDPFRIGHRIALPATRRQAHELNAIIDRQRLSCSVVTTRRPTISDVRVQLLGKAKDVAAA
jgi:ABC-type multidrug transport system ATPase subunit